MDAQHQDPKTLGRCLYCTLPVTDADGLEIEGGSCIHSRCSRMQDSETSNTIDFLYIVTQVEVAIEPYPPLYSHYWDHVGNRRFVPNNYAAMVSELIELARQNNLTAVLEELAHQVPLLIKLTADTH